MRLGAWPWSWASPWRWDRSWRWRWSRCGGRCRSCRGCGGRCRRRVRHERSLDFNSNGRTCLKESDVGSAFRRCCGRIEPEIIKRAPPNSVGVLVLRKSFAIPHGRVRKRRRPIHSESPGSTAIASVALGPIMCPSRMLRRRMKSDIAQIRRKTWKNNFEGLDGTIQVHVKHSVVIMPNSGGGASHLVTDEKHPIVPGIRLNLLYRGARSCPDLNSGLHSDGRTDWWKIEKCGAAAD